MLLEEGLPRKFDGGAGEFPQAEFSSAEDFKKKGSHGACPVGRERPEADLCQHGVGLWVQVEKLNGKSATELPGFPKGGERIWPKRLKFRIR